MYKNVIIISLHDAESSNYWVGVVDNARSCDRDKTVILQKDALNLTPEP